MSTKKFTALLLLFIMLLAINILPAQAQGGGEGDEYPPGIEADAVNDIAEDMYCDVCAGVSLKYCGSPQCQAWREEIAGLLYEGKSEGEIREHFADRYGDKVASIPINETDRFIAYAAPVAMIALIGAGILTIMIGWRRETHARQVARKAGTVVNDNRPLPDNVDPTYLKKLLILLEEKRG